MSHDRVALGRYPAVFDLAIGVFLALVVLVAIFAAGRIWGHKAAVWMCDDTTYSRTSPVGFDVIGPTVRPVPGCGE